MLNLRLKMSTQMINRYSNNRRSLIGKIDSSYLKFSLQALFKILVTHGTKALRIKCL